jgi:hypothetical protein
MRRARNALLSALTLSFAVVAIACSDSDADEPPTQSELNAYCDDVARTSDALQDVRDAMVPIDEVKMGDARADARASLDYLDGSSRELEGGSDLVVQLKEDLNELLEIIATPDLLPVMDQINAQIAVIQDDIYDLEAAGNCP